MKQLFILIIMITASFTAVIAQSSISQDGNLFVQEKIGTSFNQFSIMEGDVQVIFHKDRIELISEEEGEKDFFFIKLNNVSFELPEGEGMVSSEQVPVKNSSMAKVLGSNTIEKSYFKTLSYTDANTGKSMEVSMNANKLEFIGIGDIPLELQLWGNPGESNSENAMVELERFGKTITLTSDSRRLSKKDSVISFKSKDGSDDTNLQLSISIL